MAVKIEHKFVVRADPDRVWEFLTDPHRVAAALPGAELTEQIDERTFAGKMTVRVGPMSPSFRGKLRFERLDEAERIAEMVGSGRGLAGIGNAEMTMRGHVVGLDAGGSEVSLHAEAKISGVLAQFGRGMIQDVSARVIDEFAANMREQLESQDLG